MRKWMDRLHEKNALVFALIWIGIYCLINSLANMLSDAVGLENSVTCVANGILTVWLIRWIRKKGLLTYYGLCKSKVPASGFLYYLPLALFASTNLWLGVACVLPLAEVLCYILSMLCVGFLEEVIFRGLLFNAMVPDFCLRHWQKTV